MRRLTKQLLEKSRAAFILSLDVYNSVSKQYKTEAFSILISNAWELLLKAKIYQDSNGKETSIYLKKKPNQKRETISIDMCLRQIFITPDDPVRSNIEFVSGIRNKAAHLVINEFSPLFSRAFQRGTLNYIDLYKAWFDDDPTGDMNPGLLALIVDEASITDIAVLKKRFSPQDLKELIDIQSEFKELERLGEKATFTIEHKFVIEKNPTRADYVFTKGATGKEVAVIEKMRDIDRDYPYIQKTAIEVIEKAVEHTGTKFGQYDFQSYINVKKLTQSNNAYRWKTKFNPSPQYSQKLVDEIVEEIQKDPAILTKWRVGYGVISKNKRARKIKRSKNRVK